jgi:hypothetical protein
LSLSLFAESELVHEFAEPSVLRGLLEIAAISWLVKRSAYEEKEDLQKQHTRLVNKFRNVLPKILSCVRSLL